MWAHWAYNLSSLGGAWLNCATFPSFLAPRAALCFIACMSALFNIVTALVSPFFRMSLDSFFAKAGTKDGDNVLQAAQAVAEGNQKLQLARQNLHLTQLRQQQANAEAEAAKAAKEMVQIEKEMTAQKAIDLEAKLTQSTEILQACIDEMVDTNEKVWAAIEDASNASDAVYCSAPAAKRSRLLRICVPPALPAAG
jgi:hypothetical protein